ncbi:hypothetical protein G9464_06525 [Halostella sp. JP-L12]|uniref:DUF7556 family protein n=1 Tax=Halostella TaxID=1843185 RepID=UPI0013CE962B|nr:MULTISPECIES: hypothetical protein [Halostella]NHN47252.1 hypothetical protein [Halostella sp. JP-L12]
MNPEPETVDGRPVATGDVMAAIDEIDGRPHLVVADVDRDGAWVAMAETDAAALADWR